MLYEIKLTALGAAKLAAASTSGPAVSLTTMAVGDGNGNPIPTDPLPTSLVHEVYRHQLNSLFVNANDSTIMMAELVILSAIGGWTIREIAIIDADGDTFAIGAFPATVKPTAVDGGTRDMDIFAAIKVGNSADVQLVIDTSIVTATRPWVLATITAAYLIPGGLTGQVLKKSSNADGAFVWEYITDAINITVDVIEEPQTSADGQTIFDLTTCTTDGVAVYIAGAREFNFTVNTTTRLTLDAPLPAGTKIWFVQNEPNEPLKLRRTITGRGYFMGQLA